MLPAAARLREILHILGREATPFVRLSLASVLVLVMAAAILTALGPVALKLIVDGLANQSHRGPISPLWLVGLYVVSQWLAKVTAQVRLLIYGRIERRIFRTLSQRLFAHLMHLPLRFHLDRQTGAISETLNNGLDGFQMILQHLVFTGLPVAAELATVLVVLGRNSQPLFLALFAGALMFYSSAFAYSAAALSESARTASAARVEAGAAITDSLLNYETVKYFNGEATVQERVCKALSRSEVEWVTFYRRYAHNGLIVASVFAAFLAATTWYAMVEVNSGHITVGTFVLVNTYMLQLVQPVEMLGYAMQGFSQGFAMLEKMLQLFRESPEPGLDVCASSGADPGTLEFDQVCLSYRYNRPVLIDVSFQIRPRGTLAIVGPSGSGKSTIVRLLMRLLEPDGGQILLNEVPISRIALPQLRDAVAVVPQETVLFNDTIGYNIAFGRSETTLREVERAARIAHLHDFIMSLPDAYETRVGERGVKLSGGEKQRVSIARAILKRPRLYVFDEATSSLDSQTEQEILVNLREIAKHSSTLVIAHRLSTVVHADEIVVLDNGRIAERGTHPGLLGQGGLYASLWRAQHPGAAAA